MYHRIVPSAAASQDQYTYTLQDLLGLGIEFGSVLPDDEKSETGFSNNGEVLQSSPLHIDYYQEIARRALEAAIVVGERPAPSWYRVTLGKGIGEGLVAGRTGGYQSVPVEPDDFTVELLDSSGVPKEGVTEDEREELDALRRRISLGLRGSSQSRFRMVDEGMVLYGALPHREKVPKSWQGPSPNLKLEMQRCFPERGDFVLRVRASRGFLVESNERLLIDLEEPAPVHVLGAEESDGVRVLAALDSDERQNLAESGATLTPVAIPEPASARFQIETNEAGYYQVDLVHPPVATDGMPSVRLSLNNLTLDRRLELTDEQLAEERLVTALGAAYLPAGNHVLKVGGPFFVGFESVVLTPLADDHPAVAPLELEADELAASVAELVPSLRAFVGTRTDDGMDYKTFGESVEVHAPYGSPEVYTFRGRLENLPIPEPESGDLEILSGFMVLGFWNDHLVKSSKEPGPPILVEAIEFEAPYYDTWPPESHTRIFVESPWRDDEELYTREVLGLFLERAFRRPVSEEEVERYTGFWRQIRGDYEVYEESVREVLVAALCSPNFLYLAEPVTDVGPTGARHDLGEERAVSHHALASRLSYFLWNSPPDDVLADLARRGRLDAELSGQVDRMLEDERAWRFVRTFAREWLRLDRHELMTIDVDRYPAYTRFVKRDMAEETYRFVHEVLRSDRSVFALIDSDFAMLNQNLAEFYGVEGVVGNHFRPVPVGPELGRGGLLAQGAFLAGHSDGSQPHPIKRAVWLKEKILGDRPPAPPPNVPDLDPETPGFDEMTLKEQLEAHRDNPSCYDCHAGIDPYGLVFERYSAVGLLEEERKGKPIDASSVLPNGIAVDGLDDLKAYILESEQDAFVTALIEHLLAYALGRDVGYADEDVIAEIRRHVADSGYGMRSVIEGIVLSPPFREP